MGCWGSFEFASHAVPVGKLLDQFIGYAKGIPEGCSTTIQSTFELCIVPFTQGSGQVRFFSGLRWHGDVHACQSERNPHHHLELHVVRVCHEILPFCIFNFANQAKDLLDGLPFSFFGVHSSPLRFEKSGMGVMASKTTSGRSAPLAMYQARVFTVPTMMNTSPSPG